jgi:hypothetical protein
MELPIWKLLPDTYQSQMELHLDKLDTPLTYLEAPNECSLVQEEGGGVPALSYSFYSWHSHWPIAYYSALATTHPTLSPPSPNLAP